LVTGTLQAGIREKIVEAIRAGAFGESAAKAAGVSARAFYAWQQLGRDLIEQIEEGKREFDSLTDHEQACCHLAREVAEASLEVQLRHTGVIERAALDGDWRASAWFLERRHPDLYQRQERHQLARSDEPSEPIVCVLEMETTAASLKPEYYALLPDDERKHWQLDANAANYYRVEEHPPARAGG
jgi:hypothetical protein